jgi:protein-L-isoaspartate(D-aspartate) O-methyltransferase
MDMTIKPEWQELIQNLINQGILHSPNIIRAMRLVNREQYLPDRAKPHYAIDTPLPIGWGQTISAPHMVAIMNEALQLQQGQKILEIGTGSGWHASTIAEAVAPSHDPKENWGHVYTTEIIKELTDDATQNINKTGYADRVTIINTDGSLGYPPEAPYDRILTTAAAPNIPQPLIDQLKNNAILVIPVGSAHYFQTLIRVTKKDNKLTKEDLGGVAFVPLTGKYGQQ